VFRTNNNNVLEKYFILVAMLFVDIYKLKPVAISSQTIFRGGSRNIEGRGHIVFRAV